MRIFSVIILALLILFNVPASALEIKETKTDGQKIWYSENHQNPIISIKIAFKNAGSSNDPEDKLGLAYFTAAMLNEGADDIRSEEFQRLLEDNSIGFGADADMDNFYVTVKTLSANLDLTLELLNLAITKPNFEPQDFERVKQQLITGLKKKQESVQEVAGDEFSKLVFGKHSYSKISEGTLESIEKITPEDLHKYVAANFAKNNFSIAIAGDVTKASVEDITHKIMNGLVEKSDAQQAPIFDAFPEKQDVHIEKDFPQTVILFAKSGIDRTDKDFYAAYLLNHILGGSDFQSRLYKEVREKRGLTYYSWTSLQSYASANLFIGGVATESSKMQESIDVIKEEIKKLGASGVTDKELEAARSYVIGAYPFSMDSSMAIASHMLDLQLEGLPRDYPTSREALFKSVTLEQVNAVAKKWLGDDKTIFLSVGKTIAPKEVAPKEDAAKNVEKDVAKPTKVSGE